MADSWTRAWRVTVGPPGELGRSWTQNRVSFSVERDRSSDPNKATIRVANLSPASREMCARGDQVVVLEAGYEQGPRLKLFQGWIMRCVSEHGRGEWETVLEAEDRAQLAEADEIITLSRGPGATPLGLLQELLQSVGAPSRIVNTVTRSGEGLNVPDSALRPFVYGCSIHAPVRRAVQQLAEAAGFEVSVQNGVVVCVPVDGHTGVPAPKLTPATGLVGRPQRATIEVSHRRRGGRRKEKPGATYRCLLNTMVEPASRVFIESAGVTGVFVNEKVRYLGDSHGQDWYAEGEAVEEGA